jgi:dipeptidyl aminopeptidase/acylaminoacyl peptidase
MSPAAHSGRITAPLVMLQGEEDFICPPEQARLIVDALASRGVWHRYLTFPGEGHGFRLSTSLRDSLRAEADLYRQAMGIAVDLDVAAESVRPPLSPSQPPSSPVPQESS